MKGKYIPQWFCLDYVTEEAGSICKPLSDMLKLSYREVAELGIKTMQEVVPDKITTLKLYDNCQRVKSIRGTYDYVIGLEKIIFIRDDENSEWETLTRKDKLDTTPKEANEIIKSFKDGGCDAEYIGRNKITGECFQLNPDELPHYGF